MVKRGQGRTPLITTAKMSKRKVPEPEILPGIFYVKEILKRRKRKGGVEFLVSWQDYENENTWEPVKNLPPEMVAAFGNRRKKRKASATEEADDSQPEMVASATEEMASATEEADDSQPEMVASATEDATSLQDNLVEEISKRENSKQFSKKARSRTDGQFYKKGIKNLSWRNYVRVFFKQHPGFEMQCCGKKYSIADSFITHRHRFIHHTLN